MSEKEAVKQIEKEKKPKKIQAVGFIETQGLVASIVAADAMLKAADVQLVGSEKIGSGLVTIVIEGDVGAVKASIDSAVEVASEFGSIVASHVIARPHEDCYHILP